MDIIEKVCGILSISREEAINNSKKIDDELTYYWSPVRGGGSLIVDDKGNYLAATSSVSFDRLLDEYRKGERVKSFFNS